MIRFSAQLRQAVSWLGQKRLALQGGKQALTGPGVPSALRWLCPLGPFVLLQERDQGPAGGRGSPLPLLFPSPAKRIAN